MADNVIDCVTISHRPATPFVWRRAEWASDSRFVGLESRKRDFVVVASCQIADSILCESAVDLSRGRRSEFVVHTRIRHEGLGATCRVLWRPGTPHAYGRAGGRAGGTINDRLVADARARMGGWGALRVTTSISPVIVTVLSAVEEQRMRRRVLELLARGF